MRIDLSGKEYTKKYHPMDVKSCKIESVCACTGILFFLPLVSAPNSRYGRYWANQGLLVLFFEILCSAQPARCHTLYRNSFYGNKICRCGISYFSRAFLHRFPDVVCSKGTCKGYSVFRNVQVYKIIKNQRR